MQEFVDFLGRQPPWAALDLADLERLARALEVEFLPAGSTVIAPGSPPLDRLYVIRTGAAEVVDRGRVVDELHTGDTFGHVSVLSGMPPVLSVRTTEDTLCYLMPDPRPLVEHPERLRFEHYARQVAVERMTTDAPGGDRAHQPVSRYARPAVRCPVGATVREVAAAITDAGQSCAVVDLPPGGPHRHGIVTDSDLRTALARGAPGPDDPAAMLASAPMLAVDAATTAAVALLEMVEHGVHHLVVADPAGRPVGLVRAVDLASAEVRDPLLVRAAVAAATDLDALARAARLLPATAVELAESGVPATRVGALLATITEAVVRRSVAVGAAPVPEGITCSWLLLGSLARREALVSSDVDTAVAWTLDPHPPAATTDADAPARAVRAAAESLLGHLERCGFARCPSGSNATEPAFARSADGWRAAVGGWLRDPAGERALLRSTMLVDCRPATEQAVGRTVVEALTAHVPGPQFRQALLDYTLAARPPVGFVRGLVVEQSGEHRGQLDLKRGGLRPLASLGRWAALLTGDLSGTTPQRLERAATAGLLSAGEAGSLVEVYQHLSEILLRHEVAAVREGRTASTYLDPRTLDPVQRRFLRECFRTVAHVQSRIEADWAARPR